MPKPSSPSCSSNPIASLLLPIPALLDEAIAAVTSSILRPDILTLGILDLIVTRDRDDPTILLPNISDRDY